MTRWHALIALIYIAPAAFGQNSGCLGFEITEVIRNSDAKIRIGYSISGQWSAEAVSSFHIRVQENNSVDKAPSMELSFRYWPHECYKGTYLSMGPVCGFKSDTDLKLGLGYSIPICKCIGIDLGYGIKIIDTIRQKTATSGKITLDIHYLF